MRGSLVAVAFAQLGAALVWFNAGAVASAVSGTARVQVVAAAATLTVGAIVVGWVAGGAASPVARGVGDLSLAFGVAYLAVALLAALAPEATLADTASADPSAAAQDLPAGAVAAALWPPTMLAGVLWWRRRRFWLQLSTVAAGVGALLATLALHAAMTPAIGGGYLLAVALWLAAATLAGWSRPTDSGYVLAGLVAVGGALAVSTTAREFGLSIGAAVALAAFAFTVRTGRAALLPLGTLALAAVLPRMFVAHLGIADGIGTALVVSAAAVALAIFLASPPQRGALPDAAGMLGLATVAAVTGSVVLQVSAGFAGAAAGAAALCLTLAAGAVTQRRWVIVVCDLALVVTVPRITEDLFGPAAAPAAIVAAGTLLAAGGVLLGRLGRAAPAAQEQRDTSV